jgi:hypothetical protein
MIKTIAIYKDISKYIEEHLSIDLAIIILCFSLGAILPTHWFWHWNPAWSYWSGIMMEPWVPKVFVSSLLVLLLWVITIFRSFLSNPPRGRGSLWPHFRQFSFLNEQRQLKKEVLGAVLLSIAILGNITFSLVPLAALSFWLQTLSGPLLLTVWLMRIHPHPGVKSLWHGILAGVAIQAGLAWWQYLTQSELGGYWLLGQPNFDSISLAKSQLSALSIALPYGSTPHPNVLAGWLVLGLGLIWSMNVVSRPWHKLAWSILLLFPLAWTESWAAWVTLILIMLLPRWFNFTRSSLWMRWLSLGLICITSIVIVLWPPLILPTLQTNTSFSRREVLLTAAPRLLFQRPQGWGPVQHPIGLNPEEKQELRSFSRQPIHAAGIGGVVDLGIWTLFLLSSFYNIVHKKYSNFILLLSLSLPIFSLDHFGYSTISGQFLIIFFSLFIYNIFYTVKPRTI